MFLQDPVITPSLLLDGLAVLCALCGSWLLLTTRWRAQRSAARLAGGADALDADGAAAARRNGAFYCVGFAGLGLALACSWAARLF